MPSAPLLVPVSVGELLDKKTILEIKRERIADAAQRANVERELALLIAVAATLPANDEVRALEAQLKQVNERIWDLENLQRRHVKAADFGGGFVDNARTTYASNDERAALKRRINALLDSPIVEEKSHT